MGSLVDKFLGYLALVLKHEGGYVNHPKDPGGATNYGITQAVYNSYLDASGKKPQSVALITSREVEAIYRSKYWLAISGDSLPLGWDYAMFDFAVNSGPSRAIIMAQTVLRLNPDGVLGPKTRDAIANAPPEALDRYLDSRIEFLVSLKNWPTFGKGWKRRVDGVRETVQKLVKR